MSEHTWPPAVPGDNTALQPKRAIRPKPNKQTAGDLAQLFFGSVLIFAVIVMAYWYIFNIPFNHAAYRHGRIVMNRQIVKRHMLGEKPMPVAPLSPFDKWVSDRFFPQYRDSAP